MKPIFLKELREQLALAVIATALLTLVLMLNLAGAGDRARNAALSGGYGSGEEFQPLLSPNTFMSAGIVCGLFAVVLGFRQIHTERHRDLRSFLLHRPIEPLAILRAKVAAGVLLYGLGAGLPLGGFILLAAQPGRVAAPFEWAMALPLVALFCAGLTAYAGGLLTGLRKARWYVSRGTGMGIPIAAGVIALVVPEFWHGLLVLGLATIPLALAVRGSFLANGHDQAQPRHGMAGLAIVTAISATVALSFAFMFALNFARLDRDFRYSQYQITKDGRVLRLTQMGSELLDVVDLAGQPVLNPATGRAPTLKDLQPLFAFGAMLQLIPTEEPGSPQPPRHRYAQSQRHFQPLHAVEQNLWYLTREGRVVGYHGITRRFAGEIRSASVPGASPDASSFLTGWQTWNGFRPYEAPVPLATRRALYALDLKARTADVAWTVPGGDELLGYTDSGWMPQAIGTNHVAIATRRGFHHVGLDGTVLLSFPLAISPTDHPSILCYNFAAGAHRMLQLNPPYRDATRPDQPVIPARLIRIDKDGRPGPLEDLPPLAQPSVDRPAERALLFAMPPAMLIAINGSVPGDTQAIRWGVAALFGVMGLILARRSGRPPLSTLGWTVFHLAFGLPGLLAYLALQERTPKETCAGCGRARVVTRETCEHCAAAFAPPAHTGTEIFAPLTSA